MKKKENYLIELIAFPFALFVSIFRVLPTARPSPRERNGDEAKSFWLRAKQF